MPLIGGILVRKGVITQQDLDRAISKQKQSGELIGTTLLNMRALELEDLVEALCEQISINRQETKH